VPGMKNRLTARIHRRPLAMLDPADIKASFAKKSNKSRFNRLKRLGRLEFRRLTDPAEFERIYDEFIVYYDFRQGAVHQATPFRQDPLKREFHRALFLASATDERHLTVTYLDGRMIAAFWGSVSGKMVHLGMLVHSPLLGEHSPGKLHLMLLADHLLKEGKEVLDMTPGGAPWKERFANAHDDVADVLLYRSAFARKRIEMQARLLQEANRCAARVGVQPAHIRGVLAKLTSIRSSLAVNRASEDRELRVYRADRAVGNRSSCDTQIACNSVSHLLCFEGGGPSQSRDVFLSDALSRLERGETVYTMCSDDRLAHCCWMIRNQTKLHMAEVQQSVQLPPRSVVLCNYYTHPDFRTAECYRAMFETMLAEAYTDISTRHVFIAMPAENLPMRNLIEALDFQYRGSLSWNGHLGAKTNSAYVLCGQDQTFAQAETANK
ncbi:MAG: GNAT family N-acetyltransferase, partial [Gammaproteobacteria bacterium]